MNRRQRIIFLLVVFWGVVIGASGVWLWRADRQEKLNRQLIAAIKREDTPAALVALKQGADANARDELMVPAWEKLWDLVRGRRTRPSKAPTALQSTLIGERIGHDIQILKEDPQLIRALLAHGAHVNEVDEDESPLFSALVTGKIRTAHLLIEHGASINGMPDEYNLFAFEIMGCRDTALAELMLQHGANINRPCSPGWFTPLAIATTMRDPVMVRFLLCHHADPNIPLATRPNVSLLEYARQNHLTEIANLLRDAGAK